MCKVLCVTSRLLAGDGFRRQLERIACSGVSGVILREKDMDEEAYAELAAWAKEVCGAAGMPLILHTYVEAARALRIRRLHLPLHKLLSMSEEEKRDFDVLGASVHSAGEAVQAQRAGAAYITAGHVYATDCKKGLPPRGISFLREVCGSVDIPVFAIGGITPENASECVKAGTSGVCLMSSLMRNPNPSEIINLFDKF